MGLDSNNKEACAATPLPENEQLKQDLLIAEVQVLALRMAARRPAFPGQLGGQLGVARSKILDLLEQQKVK